MKRKHHKEVKLALASNCVIKVDAGITELIRLMNFPGLETTNSCQGDYGSEEPTGKGYVQFTGTLAKRFFHELLDALLDMPSFTQLTFDRWADNDAWPDSYGIRWNTYDYPIVLELVKTASRRTQLAI